MADSKKRVRSPKFPFIDLETAIQRASTFYESEKRNSASIPVAMKTWDYNDKSSGGQQTVSTLKEFGLMEDYGNKEARRVKLTDRALRIILDKREDLSQRDQLVQEAALLPKIHETLWERHEHELPSDTNLKHYLMFDYETPFNKNSVDVFIAQFRSTLAFAKLDGSDTISEEGEDKDENESGREADDTATRIKVGDYVQWESQGVLQFPEPKRVRALSEDSSWAFVDGSQTGVPVKELELQDSPAKAPPTLPLPAGGVPAGTETLRYRLPKGSRADVTFSGPITQPAIAKLIALLDLEKDTYPVDSE